MHTDRMVELSPAGKHLICTALHMYLYIKRLTISNTC